MPNVSTIISRLTSIQVPSCQWWLSAAVRDTIVSAYSGIRRR